MGTAQLETPFQASCQTCTKLHHFAAAAVCSEIVDRAKKEEKIEKDIKKIDITWSTLALVFSPLPDSDVTALQVGARLGCLLVQTVSACCPAGGCHQPVDAVAAAIALAWQWPAWVC